MGFAYEERGLNQTFYVQHVGCITTCKNSWKVSYICLILTYLATTPRVNSHEKVPLKTFSATFFAGMREMAMFATE